MFASKRRKKSKPHPLTIRLPGSLHGFLLTAACQYHVALLPQERDGMAAAGTRAPAGFCGPLCRPWPAGVSRVQDMGWPLLAWHSSSSLSGRLHNVARRRPLRRERAAINTICGFWTSLDKNHKMERATSNCDVDCGRSVNMEGQIKPIGLD